MEMNLPDLSKEHLIYYVLTNSPVVTFNADPYCVEKPNQIAEVVQQILDNSAWQITATEDDDEELVTALLRLDYTSDDKDYIAVVSIGDMTMAIDYENYYDHDYQVANLNENTPMAFKVSGGGGNRRKVVFLDYNKKIDEYISTLDLLPPLGEPDENGDPTDDLTTPDKEWRDSVGNPAGLTNAMVASGFGRIDLDGDYNTTYVKRLGDITYGDTAEIKAIDDYSIKVWLIVNSDIDITDVL